MQQADASTAVNVLLHCCPSVTAMQRKQWNALQCGDLPQGAPSQDPCENCCSGADRKAVRATPAPVCRACDCSEDELSVGTSIFRDG